MSTKLDLDALRGHTAVIERNAHYAWQMLSAINDSDPSADRQKAVEAAWRVYSELLAYRARDAAVAELVAALEKIAVDQPFSDDCYEIASGALAAFRQGAARED